MRGLYSSGKIVRGSSCLSNRCSIISRNVTISGKVEIWISSCVQSGKGIDGPWRVSESLSKDMYFCLNMAFPFLSSTRDGVFTLSAEYDACIIKFSALWHCSPFAVTTLLYGLAKPRSVLQKDHKMG
jgi:hypothetical protein